MDTAGPTSRLERQHAIAAVLALALGDALLLHLAPFRFGLLSLVLYPAPTTALIAGLRPRRTTPLLTCAAVALALPVAAALPIGLLQRHIAADQWIHAQVVPDQALPQVVDTPSLRRQPYRFDPGSGQLTMMFGIPGALTDTIWTAAETVTEGENPCGPVTIARGDATDQGTPLDCRPFGNGLWRLSLPSAGNRIRPRDRSRDHRRDRSVRHRRAARPARRSPGRRRRSVDPHRPGTGRPARPAPSLTGRREPITGP